MAAPTAPRPKRLIARREWVGVVVFSVVVAGVMLLPLARWRADERPGWRFTGILTGYFSDAAGHLSWARQSYDGDVLFESKFAGADPDRDEVFNLMFLVMGRAARWTGMTVIEWSHVQRTVIAILVLILAYRFAAAVFDRPAMRWTALVLAATSAGFQLIGPSRQVMLEHPDVELVQASTFRSLGTDVMIGPATLLNLVAVMLAYRALRRRGWRSILAAGLVLTVQAGVHPHDCMTILVVVASMVLFRTAFAAPTDRWPTFRRGLAVGFGMLAVATPLLVYHFIVLIDVLVYGRYTGLRNPYLTASWWYEFGLVFFAGVMGAAAIVVRRERHRLLPVAWVVAVALVLAVPIELPLIHVYNGFHIVLCVLATRGLWALGGVVGRGWSRRRPRLARGFAIAGLAGFVAAASITNVMAFRYQMQPHVAKPPRFLHEDELAALTWLDEHAGPNDVVASLEFPGIVTALWTGSRVYMGDGLITPDAENRSQQMHALMSAEGPLKPDTLAGILRAAQADYIYVDSTARRLGSAGNERGLLDAGFADRTVDRPLAAVYRVSKGAVADVFIEPTSRGASPR